MKSHPFVVLNYKNNGPVTIKDYQMSVLHDRNSL